MDEIVVGWLDGYMVRYSYGSVLSELGGWALDGMGGRMSGKRCWNHGCWVVLQTLLLYALDMAILYKKLL